MKTRYRGHRIEYLDTLTEQPSDARLQTGAHTLATQITDTTFGTRTTVGQVFDCGVQNR
jgi:hypothetical protein